MKNLKDLAEYYDTNDFSAEIEMSADSEPGERCTRQSKP